MRIISATAFLLAGALPTTAGQCTDYEIMSHQLNTKYNEFRRVAGISGNQVMEIFVTDDNTSFTIVMRTTNNIGCMVSAGKTIVFLAKRVRPRGKEM